MIGTTSEALKWISAAFCNSSPPTAVMESTTSEPQVYQQSGAVKKYEALPGIGYGRKEAKQRAETTVKGVGDAVAPEELRVVAEAQDEFIRRALVERTGRASERRQGKQQSRGRSTEMYKAVT